VYHRYDSEGNLMYNNLENAVGAMPSVAAMLPTPRAPDGTKGGPNQRGSSGDLMLPSAVMNLE
jgi:DNA (cytosine-5)-methyltransferase 1